jgi:thiol-disulfide isomerase/thioredoxin
MRPIRTLMKEVVTNLVLFTVLALVFSSLTGCTGTTANSNKGSNTPPVPPRVDTDPNKASIYPALPQTFAEAQMEMLDGSKSRIGDHKGKALILNLWAIWCGPCRDEMPHLAAMQKQYGNTRLEVISLNIGDHDGVPEPIDNIKKFATDNKIDYTLGRISMEGFRQFVSVTKQTPIPQTVMVDRDGRLRGVFIGGGPNAFASMQQTIDKIMNEG